MLIEKNQGESPLEFHKRIIYGKLVDKTLADIDFSELSEPVYGQTYSSDVARRMMYGSRKTLELLEQTKLPSDIDSLNEIENRMIELRKEQQRFYDQRREFNKVVSVEGRKEHIYDALIASANMLPETIGGVFQDAPIISDHFSSAENEAVLVFSDWHYGMTTNNVFNTYNTDICKQRIINVVNNARQRIVLNHCSKLHIVVLGDIFHGAIHASARVAAEELVCDQLMQASELLAQAIFDLSKCVDETIVYTTYGNHARTVQNKKDSLHRDNMERLVPWWLEQRIIAEEHFLGTELNIKVTPESDTEFLFIDACGHEICASHGDLDSVKSSPRLLTTLFQKKYGKDIECIILGDKHHRETFDELGVTAMICGSLCGTDDHASDKRLFSSPSQLLLIVNSDIGVDAEYRLKCE